jgi:hypothetical protein
MLLGDSHILSYAHRPVRVYGDAGAAAVPLLVTGLRAFDWRANAPPSPVLTSLHTRVCRCLCYFVVFLVVLLIAA